VGISSDPGEAFLKFSCQSRVQLKRVDFRDGIVGVPRVTLRLVSFCNLWSKKWRRSWSPMRLLHNVW